MHLLIIQRCKYFTSISIVLLIMLITRYCAYISRSRQLHKFCKIAVLKNFQKFRGKHVPENIFFNKLQPWGMQLYKETGKTVVLFKMFSINLLIFWRVSDLPQKMLFCLLIFNTLSHKCYLFLTIFFRENWYSHLRWFLVKLVSI